MNFFRSEDHLSKWEGFQEDKKEGIIALSDAMRLFSGPFFTKRREPDYLSHMARYVAEIIAIQDTLEHAGSYWRLKWFEKPIFSFVLKLKSK
jgi:hypothetical protein